MEIRIVRIYRDLLSRDRQDRSGEVDLVVRVCKRSLQNRIIADFFSDRTGQLTRKRIVSDQTVNLIGQFRIGTAVDLRLGIGCYRDILCNDLAGGTDCNGICGKDIIAITAFQSSKRGICNIQDIGAVEQRTGPSQSNRFFSDLHCDRSSRHIPGSVIHLGVNGILEVRIGRIDHDLFGDNAQNRSGKVDVVVRVCKRSLQNRIIADIFPGRTGQLTRKRIVSDQTVNLIGQFRIGTAVNFRPSISRHRDVFRGDLARGPDCNGIRREDIVVIAAAQAGEGCVRNAYHILAVELTISPVQRHCFATNHNRKFRPGDSRIAIVYLGINGILEARIVRINRDLLGRNCNCSRNIVKNVFISRNLLPLIQ